MKKKKPTVIDFLSWLIGSLAALGLCCYASYDLLFAADGFGDRMVVLGITALALWSVFWFISVAWRELRRLKSAE